MKKLLEYQSVAEIVREAEEMGLTIGELVLRDQAAAMETTTEVLMQKMTDRFDVMMESVRRGGEKDQRSMSGLTGGDGYRMSDYAGRTGGGLCGSFLTGAMARALSVASWNASMGRIVAAPTAGSCGILPGCLVSLYEEKQIPKEKVVLANFTAGGLGMVIAQRACLSGAQGGCQAECGSAAGMAAAAVTELMGGTPQMCADACAMALVSQMGLVCDPVAGLVEIPCIKRNVSGVMIAFSSADMALAGIQPKIPVDECIDAMREVGEALPGALKETAIGGLAATPTAQKLKEKVFGKND